MSRPLAQSVVDAAFESGEAMIDSAVTIAARLPILAAHLISPTPDGMSEWHSASSEKVLALYEGALAAISGWNGIAWRSLFTPVTPVGYAQEAVVLARAIAQPGHSRVRANASRFGHR